MSESKIKAKLKAQQATEERLLGVTRECAREANGDEEIAIELLRQITIADDLLLSVMTEPVEKALFEAIARGEDTFAAIAAVKVTVGYRDLAAVQRIHDVLWEIYKEVKREGLN